MNPPPYSGSALPGNGVLTEIVTAAFARKGYRVELKLVPWKRGLNGTRDGLYDGIFGIWNRPERESWFIYSRPLIANEIVFFKHSDSNVRFDGDFRSLQNYRIGYIRGYAYPPGLEEMRDFLHVEMVTDNITNLMKLELGRLDLVMIDRLLARHLIATELRASADAFTEIDFILARDPNHLAFSRKAAHIEAKVNAFNRGLAAIERDGTLKQIRRRHGF